MQLARFLSQHFYRQIGYSISALVGGDHLEISDRQDFQRRTGNRPGQGIEFKEGKNVYDQLDPLPEGDWVNRQTARVIAQSIVVPCLVRIHASDQIDKILGPEGEGVNHPPMLACVYMIVKLPQLNKPD